VYKKHTCGSLHFGGHWPATLERIKQMGDMLLEGYFT
jgi:hypothetical protein